jgi:undecaprenyl-diphosphatase
MAFQIQDPSKIQGYRMTFLQAIILGIVQGLTEFLPISSSAHLILIPFLLGWKIPISEVFVFDVLVQLGTLAAVIIYFRKDLLVILSEWFHGIFHRVPVGTFNSRMGWYLILATIPAGLLGITIKSKVEAVFNNPLLTASLLFGTAILLVVAERIGKRIRAIESMNWKDALWVGVFQAISIFPGISRSGSTISGGMIRDLDRPSATRFAFLMSIPVMLAAGLIGILDLIKVPNVAPFLPVVAVGFLTAAVVGYLAIRWLLGYITKRNFYPFAIYCAVFASLTIVFGFIVQPSMEPANTQSTGITRVSISPTLRWMAPLMNICAREQGNFQLVVMENPAPSLLESDLAIQFGLDNLEEGKGIVLGSDKIISITNPSNPVKALSQSEVAAILQGNDTKWPDGSQINIYIYSPGSEINKIISDSLGFSGGYAAGAKIAFQPENVLNNVGRDPAAFGFIPVEMVDKSVNVIEIEGNEKPGFTMEIITIYGSELSVTQNTWLACLARGIQAD